MSGCRERRNPSVIDKVAAVFESYWQQADFEEYDKARFLASRDTPRELLSVSA